MESIRPSAGMPGQVREPSPKRPYSPPAFTEVGDAVRNTTGTFGRWLEGFSGTTDIIIRGS